MFDPEIGILLNEIYSESFRLSKWPELIETPGMFGRDNHAKEKTEAFIKYRFECDELAKELPLLQKSFDPYLRADQWLTKQVSLPRLLKLNALVKKTDASKAGSKNPTWQLIASALFCGCIGIVFLQVDSGLPGYLDYSSKLGLQAWITPQWLRDTTLLLLFGVIGFSLTKLASRLADIVLDRNFFKNLKL